MPSSLGTFPSYAYLVASIPADFVPAGTTAETLDFGEVESNGVTWWPQGISGGGITPIFSNSVSATLASGPIEDLLVSGFSPGVTNRMILTPAAGGTIIGSIASMGIPDGFSIKLSNPSSTDNLQFLHLSAGAASPLDRIRCMSGNPVFIPPGGAALLSYEINVWTLL